MKTEYYDKDNKIIKRMAWLFFSTSGLPFEDLVSELNIVFCEAVKEYNPDDPTKFSHFFRECCKNRVRNLYMKSHKKKRQIIEIKESRFIEECLTHDPMESIIIYDNLVNNSNPIIRKIIRIVSIYQIPKKRHLLPWLRQILLKDYKRDEIDATFKTLHTLYLKGN